MKRILRLPMTTIAFLLATMLVCATLFTDFDLIRVNFQILERLQGLELYEVDDLLTAFLLIGVGLVVDHLVYSQRRKRDRQLQEHRLRVLKATMRTVQDIVNNCLNSLQLFRLEAEDVLSPESLALFDQLIRETAAKLTALGDLEATPERLMASGIGISYPEIGNEPHHSTSIHKRVSDPREL
jgi:hypothetical protein